jgi:hypothetical protein
MLIRGRLASKLDADRRNILQEEGSSTKSYAIFRATDKIFLNMLRYDIIIFLYH